MFTPPLKSLRSFIRPPSWINKAGRVDRSACVEVRASELWPLVAPAAWRTHQTSCGLLASATYTISAHQLCDLHERRLPRKLRGDLRTPKSNAMKHWHDPAPGKRRKKPQPHDQRWTALPDLNDFLHSNPNKGATRTKLPGVWSENPPHYPTAWQQTIRIERRQRGKEPSAARGLAGAERQKSEIRGQRSEKSKIQNSKSKIPHSPFVTRHSPPPTHQHFLLCPACNRPVFKLFMVLAMEQELLDAEFAEEWVNMIDARPHRGAGISPTQRNPSLFAIRAALVNRYGPLFNGRRLVCRKCLGLRYGEVKKSRCKFDPATGALLRAQRKAQRDREVDERQQRELSETLAEDLALIAQGESVAATFKEDPAPKPKTQTHKSASRTKPRRDDDDDDDDDSWDDLWDADFAKDWGAGWGEGWDGDDDEDVDVDDNNDAE